MYVQPGAKNSFRNQLRNTSQIFEKFDLKLLNLPRVIRSHNKKINTSYYLCILKRYRFSSILKDDRLFYTGLLILIWHR